MILISESFYDELVSPRKNKYPDIITFSPDISVTSFKHFKETTLCNVLKFSHIAIDLNFIEISNALIKEIYRLCVVEHRNIFSGLKEGSAITILDARETRLHFPPKTRNAQVRGIALSLRLGREWNNLAMLKIFLGEDFYKGRKDMVFLSWVSLPKDNWERKLFRASFIEEPSIKRLLQQYLLPISPCFTLGVGEQNFVRHSPVTIKPVGELEAGTSITFQAPFGVVTIFPGYEYRAPQILNEIVQKIKEGDIIREAKVHRGCLVRSAHPVYMVNYKQPPDEYKLEFNTEVKFENKVLRYDSPSIPWKKIKCNIGHRNILEYLYWNIGKFVPALDLYKYAYEKVGRKHRLAYTEKRNRAYIYRRMDEIKSAVQHILKSKRKVESVLSSSPEGYRLNLTK